MSVRARQNLSVLSYWKGSREHEGVYVFLHFFVNSVGLYLGHLSGGPEKCGLESSQLEERIKTTSTTFRLNVKPLNNWIREGGTITSCVSYCAFFLSFFFFWQWRRLSNDPSRREGITEISSTWRQTFSWSPRWSSQKVWFISVAGVLVSCGCTGNGAEP